MLLPLQLGTSPPSMLVPGHELSNIILPPARDANTFCDSFFNTMHFQHSSSLAAANANKLIQVNSCLGRYNLTDNFIPHTTKPKRLQ